MAPVTAEQAARGQAITSMVITAGFWPRVVQDKDIKKYAGTPWSEKGSEKSRFVYAEGVNVLSKEPYFHNPWKLSGNRVWYQFADHQVKATHELMKGLLKLDDYVGKRDGSGDHEIENLKKILRSGDEGLFMMGLKMAEGMVQRGELVEGDADGNVIRHFAEKAYFLRVFNQFRMNNSKYTGTYLSELVKTLKSDLRSTLSGAGSTPRSGKEATGTDPDRYKGRKGAISKTAGAMMREEQARVVKGGEAADTSGLIGLTQPIDTTYLTVMGRVHIDVSEMPVWEAGHHGLSGGAIMTRQEAKDLAGGEHFDEIRERVFDYYQARIPEWNEGIAAIRERALAVSGTKTVGPAAMRRAGYGMGDVSQKGTPSAGTMGGSKIAVGSRKTPSKFGKIRKTKMLNYGVGGRNTKKKLLRNASVSAKKLAQHLFAGMRGDNLNKTAASFIMHGIGTYRQHKGKYYNTLTVSKDPHVTTSIFFRMYSRNAARAYEYKNLREEQDVLVHHGFASLGVLEHLGHYNTVNYVQTVQDMSDAHLVARYVKNVRDIVKNTVMAQGARSGKGFKLKQKISTQAGEDETFEFDADHGGIGSCAVYLPTGWTKNVMARVVDIFEGRFNSTGARRAAFRSQAKMHAKPFQDFMDGIQEESTYLNTELYWPKIADFWASPYFGLGYEPPLDQSN